MDRRHALGRWSLLSLLALALTIVPFLLFEESITRWTQDFMSREGSAFVLAGGLGAALASDILLPVPSSLLSTALGYLLGFGWGAFVSWLGMTAACLVGYALGRSWGRDVARRFVGEEGLERVGRAADRFGAGIVILFRAVPVLAEASVLFAGISGMPLRQFGWMAGLSNAGISLGYAAVGAYALEANSFLVAFAGAILLPAAALLLTRNWGS
jgi:uncharacterized membrane protein YdjX (TVP38/TMEM64 family)